jgi:hypothetical protein
MDEENRRAGAAHERAARGADSDAPPSCRDAGHDQLPTLHRGDERVLRRLRENRPGIDADHPLCGERRVGQEATRVAPAAL